MRRLLVIVSLAACTTGAQAEPLPFEGRWDCEVAEFTFSASSYNNGSEELEILDIAPDGNSYVLTFADDYQLSLTLNSDGSMDWFSPVSGDSFTCRPLP